MSEENKPRTDATTERSGEIRSSTPPTKSVLGETPRKTFGDKTDDVSRRGNTSSVDDQRETESNRSGDRTEESDVRDEDSDKDATQSSGRDQRSGSGRQDQQRNTDAKSAQGQGSSRERPEVERDAKSKSQDAMPNRTEGGTHRGK
jgi:hypothetical protein